MSKKINDVKNVNTSTEIMLQLATVFITHTQLG